MWGITHISNEFFLIFEIVSDTPLISIDAFSTNCFLNKLLILKSNICDLSTFFILFKEINHPYCRNSEYCHEMNSK